MGKQSSGCQLPDRLREADLELPCIRNRSRGADPVPTEAR